jgi:hypothetical protein
VRRKLRITERNEDIGGRKEIESVDLFSASIFGRSDFRKVTIRLEG